jgi:hypothetical protein
MNLPANRTLGAYNKMQRVAPIGDRPRYSQCAPHGHRINRWRHSSRRDQRSRRRRAETANRSPTRDRLPQENDPAQLLFPSAFIALTSIVVGTPLGLAVANKQDASASGSSSGINRELFLALNRSSGMTPSWWLDQQKIASDGPSYGLVRVVRDVSDPREMSEYQADALTGELMEMLAQGWRVADPAGLDKLRLALDPDGRPIDTGFPVVSR